MVQLLFRKKKKKKKKKKDFYPERYMHRSFTFDDSKIKLVMPEVPFSVIDYMR